MASTYKVLGQVLGGPEPVPVANLYTVPAATEAVVSSIVIANLQSVGGSFSIAIRPAGAALENKHYIAKDVAISANDSTTLTLGITLSATDVVAVGSNLDICAFHIFGSEIS